MKFIDQFIGQLNFRIVCMVLIIIPAFFLGFHALIIVEILPRNIVWGGRLTDATFLPLEFLAVVLNLLLMLTGAVAGKLITARIAVVIVDWCKWFLFYFVVVNTVMGLFSTTTLEMLMTPITGLYALCLYRINRFPDGFGVRDEMNVAQDR